MDQFQDEFQQIKQILKDSGRGMSITEIAQALHKNNHSVGRYLDNLLVSGQVEMRMYGKAKVFSLSSRIPLDTMLGFADDLIIVLDQDNRIVRVSNRVLAFFKKNRHDFLGKNIFFLAFPESWTTPFFDIIRSSLTHGVVENEIQIPKKDGITFRQKIIPTVFEDGKKGVTILMEDITAKKTADSALRASEEQFRRMAENIRDGLIIRQGDQTRYINRRAEEILGRAKEELLTINPVDLAAPEEQERLQKLISDSLSAKSVPSDITFWAVRKDGTRRFISSRITHVKHASGPIFYIIITDITEMKNAQEALQNQLDFLQHMINTFPNPLFYVDIHGRYLGCNSAFCSLMGKSSEYIAGKTNEELFLEDTRKLFDEHNSDLIKKPGIITYTGIFHHPDHSCSSMTIQKSTLVARDGTVKGLVGLVTGRETVDGAGNH